MKKGYNPPPENPEPKKSEFYIHIDGVCERVKGWPRWKLGRHADILVPIDPVYKSNYVEKLKKIEKEIIEWN